jgi:hypothetical protein
MPDEKTAVTEIVTGLGASGASSVERALIEHPPSFRGVDATIWSLVAEARLENRHPGLFDAAWQNGRSFFEAGDGLRGRTPRSIEWKGPHKPPGYDSLPADLRIDHVFLVSCKYGSDISGNSSPSNLFDRLLADRSSKSEAWYETVVPRAYQLFYDEVRRVVPGLPVHVQDLVPHDLRAIRDACSRRWPTELQNPWRLFSFEVAGASAARWRANLLTRERCEAMLWRLLRLETAPYFVLGATKSGHPLRYRVATPWDWRQAFKFVDFDAVPVVAGQPLIRWTARVADLAAATTVDVSGDVEIRWSHGRFSAVEAKLHLKTPALEIPGYFSLV